MLGTPLGCLRVLEDVQAYLSARLSCRLNSSVQLECCGDSQAPSSALSVIGCLNPLCSAPLSHSTELA